MGVPGDVPRTYNGSFTLSLTGGLNVTANVTFAAPLLGGRPVSVTALTSVDTTFRNVFQAFVAALNDLAQTIFDFLPPNISLDLPFFGALPFNLKVNISTEVIPQPGSP